MEAMGSEGGMSRAAVRSSPSDRRLKPQGRAHVGGGGSELLDCAAEAMRKGMVALKKKKVLPMAKPVVTTAGGENKP